MVQTSDLRNDYNSPSRTVAVKGCGKDKTREVREDHGRGIV